MKNKSRIISNILSIFAPALFVVAVAITVIFGWYINTQQVANIDATTKNVAVEYTFDGGSEKNVLNYTVDNLAFFDADSTDDDLIELKYLPTMAIKLTLKLKNNSTNNINYTVTFESAKDIVFDPNDDTVKKSVAYIDCLFYEDLDTTDMTTTSFTTVNSIKDAEQDGITYENTSTSATSKAICASSSYSTPVILEPEDETTLVMYLYGVQEIDNAKNDDFLYETNNGVKSLKQYAFSITIESIPLGDVEVEES